MSFLHLKNSPTGYYPFGGIYFLFFKHALLKK